MLDASTSTTRNDTLDLAQKIISTSSVGVGYVIDMLFGEQSSRVAS